MNKASQTMRPGKLVAFRQPFYLVENHRRTYTHELFPEPYPCVEFG
jgi:hypothetical protein